jgi:hypothetical protein
MGIFDKDATEEKSDYEKIGVFTIEPYVKDGKWLFNYNGTSYPFAPAIATNAVLAPLVAGADKIIQVGADLKGITKCEEGVVLVFSGEYFPGADAKFTLLEGQFDGHVYDVEPLNLEGIPQGQKAWVCPYINLYFDEPPKTLYLKLEAKK